MGGLGGGQGGGLLSSIGGIVGGIFGGPIGAAIGGAIGNLVQDAVGQAANNTVDHLQKESGMPPFLAKEVKNAIKEAIAESKDKNVSPDAKHCVDNDKGVQDWCKDFIDELTKTMIKNVKDELDKKDGCGQSSEGGSKQGAKSWLQALAEGMGKTLGQKASKMVELSQKMGDLSDKQAANATKAADGAKNETSAEQKQADAQQAQADAAAFTKTQTELQGVSQEFSLLQSAFSNALKSIGEGLSQMGRKG
ncbi:hypothetical protein A4W93_28650 [Piscinibacter gummiphilus]|uniref:Uncharacterized protein n=1 Tax=Piscinibacter gummiphilus TaxID=946333 RepID=A0A1W6LH15_9BURK|nr:hypothetical protein A4W93_28650 [Piscinibacter gummiphilus]ATU68254.1 hypothetical protein CPZ87_28785 [Piscinibacter gummiphilus]